MAKQQNDTSEISVSEVSIAQMEAPKSIKVLCGKGEFWHNGQRYYHQNLTLEDAERLIGEGYEGIVIE